MMARGVPGGDGHDGHADSLGAVVKAEPAGEEAVAEGDVQQVAAARARSRQRARHDLAPDVEIAGGVRRDGRLALGAGGGVDPRDLASGDGQEAERVLVAEVGLANEREAGEIREPADRGGAQPLAMERNARDGPAERLLDPLELQALAGRPRHGLGLAVPDQLGRSSNPCSRRSRRISSRISRSATSGTTSRATSRTIRSTTARTSVPYWPSIAAAARAVASRVTPSTSSSSRSRPRILSGSVSALRGSRSTVPSTRRPAGGSCPPRKRKNTGTSRKRGALFRVRTTSIPETPVPGSSGSIRTTLTS